MVREEAAGSPELHGTRLVLVMTAICMTVVAYNTTAVVTILPNLKSGFDLTPTELQWVMAVYTVTGATLVPILGRLGDIVGKMKVFFFGMACFSAGSLAVVVAPDGTVLLAGRAAQGAGAAALFGTSLSLLNAATPEERRASVTGIWGAMIGLGMSLGRSSGARLYLRPRPAGDRLRARASRRPAGLCAGAAQARRQVRHSRGGRAGSLAGAAVLRAEQRR
jgi:MFS family permease